MSTNSYDDRWLLPRRQTEYPARDVLPETTVHARREATFLVLAAMFFVATTTLFLLGTSHVIDVSTLLARVAPNAQLPAALLLPLGAVPFALTFVASALVCELFGRRRASALVWVGLVASLGLVGMMRLADLIDGGGDAFGVSLAFVACYALAHAFNLVLFDAARKRARGRRLVIRMNAASLVAQAIGWTAFGFVLELGAGYVVAPFARETIIAMSLGAALCCAAGVFVLAIPAAFAVRGLAIALRVGRDPFADHDDDEASYAHAYAYDAADEYAPRDTAEQAIPHDTPVDAIPAYVAAEPRWRQTLPGFADGSVARRLPKAVIVEEEDADELDEPVELQARRRTPRASVQPFSSAEMRFFNEGDAPATE